MAQRNRPLGVLGLLGVDRGALEALVAREGEDHGDAGHAGGEDLVGAERTGGQTAQAVLGDDRDVQDEHDHELEHERDAEHAGRDGDLVVAQREHHHESDQGVEPPRSLDAEELVDATGSEETHGAARRSGQREVGAGGDVGTGETHWTAEALDDVGEEGAGVVDVRHHLGEADREQQHDGHDDHEHARRADTDAEADGQGKDGHRPSGRCHGGHHHEHDVGDVEAPLGELGLSARERPTGLCSFRHGTTPPAGTTKGVYGRRLADSVGSHGDPDHAPGSLSDTRRFCHVGLIFLRSCCRDVTDVETVVPDQARPSRATPAKATSAPICCAGSIRSCSTHRARSTVKTG